MIRRTVDVGALEIAYAEAGPSSGPAMVFLHGWPQSSATFANVQSELEPSVRTIALDLPGIGASTMPASASDKRALARVVHAFVTRLGVSGLVLVGHDIGGMIAHAYAKEYGASLAGVAILDVVIPGIAPWNDVIRNPHLWHFALHALPRLPETLVGGHVAEYFDYFFDALAADPTRIGREAREAYVAAYARPAALRVGFDWYRAFDEDARHNVATKGTLVAVSTLCVRGSHEPGDPARYGDGLRDAGFSRVEVARIEGSGHFTADEQPVALAAALRRFAGLAWG